MSSLDSNSGDGGGGNNKEMKQKKEKERLEGGHPDLSRIKNMQPIDWLRRVDDVPLTRTS